MPAEAATDAPFRLDETAAPRLAEAFGTPLYVLDEAHFRARIARYFAAFRAVAPRCELTFASKANSTFAVLAIAAEEGCRIDVASEGELRAALAAGVPAANCHAHGSDKSRQELRFAVDQGIGQIVVDHLSELDAIAGLGALEATSLVLRLAPGVDPATHEKISTGQADTKFGFNIADGSAEAALLHALSLGLPVVGFHCHVGSQLLDPAAQREGGAQIAAFAARMQRAHGFRASYLNLGGGLGVRYTASDAPTPLEAYCRLVIEAAAAELAGAGLEPVFAQEPGRSLVAESGVTLYRVGAVKTVPSPARGRRTYVSVDGGLSDNPRPALYGARYTVERVARGSGPRAIDPVVREGRALVTVSGKHCESDMLFDDVALPTDLGEGDLLQVLCTGAYNSSMASNYNRFLRPATALLRPDGTVFAAQRRETWDELFVREGLLA